MQHIVHFSINHETFSQVNYMARVKVGKCKKFSSLGIDEIIDKVEAKVAKVQLEQQKQQERKRHASLPDTLVDEKHQEKLKEQAEILRRVRFGHWYIFSFYIYQT